MERAAKRKKVRAWAIHPDQPLSPNLQIDLDLRLRYAIRRKRSTVLVVMKAQAGAAEIARVCERIEALGFKPHIIPGEQRTAIGITGNEGPIDSAEFEDLPGVAEAIRVSKPYKLVSRETKPESTIVLVNGVPVGGEQVVLCGGPCSVESC